jgi:glycosyltransferase involved in cell wall biosynthesis
VRTLHVYSGNLFGGIETMLAAIGRRAGPGSRHAHEFALCFEGRLASDLQAAGAAVHQLGPVSARQPQSVTAARQTLRAVLVTQGFDCVICHAPWTQALFGSVVRRADYALVFWAHDVVTGRHWTERLARRVVPDLVICNSRFTRGTVDRLYPDVPSVVVHAPVESPPLVDDGTRRRIRASLDTPERDVVVVQASRSEKWKGHELSIDALAELRAISDWTWWQVGGAQRPEERAFLDGLRERASRLGIAHRIRWVGERSDVPQILAAADIYCQPNVAPEPFGIAFVEALAAGLPVVTTRQGAAEEIIDDSCGVLVPPNGIHELTNALREVVTDSDRRQRLSSGGPARARELCDPLKQLERLSEALALVARPRIPA